MIKLLHPASIAFNISVLLFTSGCGLKGDLYIPDSEAAPAATAVESTDDRETESDTQADRASN